MWAILHKKTFNKIKKLNKCNQKQQNRKFMNSRIQKIHLVFCFVCFFKILFLPLLPKMQLIINHERMFFASKHYALVYLLFHKQRKIKNKTLKYHNEVKPIPGVGFLFLLQTYISSIHV